MLQVDLRSRWVRIGVALAALVLMGGVVAWGQAEKPEAGKPEAEPPKDQEVIGTKKCAACHFDQFMKWRQTKHSKTFELLPAMFQADANCLKCHTTGFGHPTGFKTAADADLKGTSCEACHGPGSKHAEVAKPFANMKPTPEQEKLARDSIWKMLPKNACVECHMVQGHHESQTPKELRKPN
jgi:mono/diheme cytochrome c family protein